MKPLIKPAIIISVLLLKAYLLCAQTDFSGTWILNHSRSDAEFKDYEMTCIITQTEHIFTVTQTIFMKNGEKSVMPAVAYNLDGIEMIKEEQGGKNRISAKWSSPDKKILTIRFVRTMDGNDYGSLIVYDLSDNGQFLTVTTSDLKGESPMVQVYNKK